MTKLFRLVMALVAICMGTYVGAQDFTNKGKDFWLCFPSHVPSGSSLANMALFLTSDQNSSGTITVGSFTTSFTVSANQVSTGISIPYSVANISANEAGTIVKNKGIHVKVDAGKPDVVLYAHIYAAARSEASLILPTSVLGSKYFSMNYIQTTGPSQIGAAQSQFNIMAVEPNTTVRYQLRRNGVLDANSTTITFQDAGDVLEIQASQDLTGSIIESIGCKNIAVFSGSSAINIGDGNTAGSSTDPLLQQCYPVNTWGKNFGMVPFVSASGLFHYRVLASEDNTTVTIDGVAVTLNAGQYYPSGTVQQPPLAKPFLITADKPISVAQYMLSSNVNRYANNGGLGDPEMVLLNPIEQNISNISVFSSNLQAIQKQFLNVFTTASNASSFKINGAAPKNTFVRLPAPNDKYAFLIEELTGYGTSSFMLKADSGFNAICYGIGNVESYGYSAGTSLHDFSAATVFQNPYGRIDSAVTCVNTPLQFSVPLSFVPATVAWDFAAAPNISPNTAVVSTGAPTADSTKTVNGQTVNYYSPGKSFVFTAANTALQRDTIKLLTTTATPNGCGVTNQTFLIPVTVRSDLPVAKFTIDADGCASTPVKFSDQSSVRQGALKQWFWDFGDNTTAQLNTAIVPDKVYNVSANYVVKLKVVSDIGCLSSETSQSFVQSAKPVANFTISATRCPDTDITLTDASTTSSGTITKWTWDPGNGGATVVNTTNAPITVKYSSDGSKSPMLKVTTSTGCESDVFTSTFNVNPLPVPGFVLPEVCLSDAFAQFTDTSRISDGSQAQFKWAWNFNAGSPAVSPAPLTVTSTAQNPQVKYNKSDNYKVSLTVTSKDGCVASVIKDFTVNGSIPKAAFEFTGTAPYCGSKPVGIKNKSTVDFGNVTRLEIYWDYVNNPTVKETDEDPAPDKIYAHAYADPSTPKSYTVRMVAYSGGTACADVVSKTFTLYPQPKAAFTSSVSQLCTNDVVTFTDKSNGVSSAAASWNWNLGGNTTSSVQNPSKQYLDSGLMNVSMYFYNADGCISDTAVKQLVVYPNPVLKVKASETVLAGGTITLTPLYVYGNQLSYKWTPSTYLGSDTAAAPKCTPADDITYHLTLTAEGGCSVSETIQVVVLKGPEVPNAFSPNGDGINDTWKIKYLDSYPDASVEVYGRSGQLVFRSTGYNVEWDGTYKGTPLPVGTYYYIINPKNGRPVISGSVTLVK